MLYQGDEIGMGNVTVTRDDLRDPLGVRFFPFYEGRDAGRTPMQWCEGPGGGFTEAPRPWLPLGDLGAANVAGGSDDPGSILTLCRDVIAYRRRHPEFALADYRSLPAPEGVWAFGRGDGHVVVLNLSSDTVELHGLSGTVVLCTDRTRDGEGVGPGLELEPSQGLILDGP